MQNSAVIVPCYKRPEYTKKCIESLEQAQDYPNTTFYLVDDASCDGTEKILKESKLSSIVIVNLANMGLRHVLVDFFNRMKISTSFKYMLKMDNDCMVPKNWLNDITHALNTLPVDILSPNVHPSNAAYVYGKEDKNNLGYRSSEFVGGLWAMTTSLIQDITFESHKINGITGAYSLLNQIIIEKEPRVGWLPQVIVQDMGHLSGTHPDHIKSEEHQQYSAEVGRRIAWSVG